MFEVKSDSTYQEQQTEQIKIVQPLCPLKPYFCETSQKIITKLSFKIKSDLLKLFAVTDCTDKNCELSLIDKINNTGLKIKHEWV